MTRRLTLLGTALALSLPLTAVSLASATAPAGAASPQPDPATTALKNLRADADGSVVVHRDSDGDVAAVSSADGGAILDSRATTPQAAVKKLLSDYGDAFGIDGENSTAQVTQTIHSATGGTIVRTQQVVDGVPVFGGQVVMSLDKDQDVSSVTSATADPDVTVPAAVVPEGAARTTALGQTARNHHVSARTLTVTDVGRRVYDPTVVGATDPFGTQPVWQFTVSNGSDVRQTVLVSTTRGSVVLSFNDAPEMTRKICDNVEHRNVADTDPVPTACTAVRTEGQADVTGAGATDINDAYDNLGHVSDAYAALDHIDLTAMIGLNLGGTKTLQGTVRWCYTSANNETCPYENAFWDGTQMVFGSGYAGALDVVGHEMTHGYVDKTSQLFAFHESGSINESVADTIGEIVDHRNGGSGDSWNLGEDLPGGVLRNMANPTVFDQPDGTQSSLYDGSDADDGDYGAVHQNDGVGNKTAYLISHGGSFGGQTVTGIDAGDPGDTKTGRLYLEMIPRLTSGADWVQYGQTLISTCQQLATADAAENNADHPFTSADCDSVAQAVAATQLLRQPASEAKQVAVSCPSGTSESLIARDDDNITTLGLTSSSPLWTTGPDDSIGLPSYAVSGTQSRFALDPDPGLGDPASGALTSAAMTLPRTGPAYLNFHDSYVFDWEGSTYYDGGQVLVQKLSGSTWQNATGLPWVNGPSRHVVATGSGFTGFGGDSHGYGSSQVDLTALRGQTVRFVFQVAGDSAYTAYGWWLDDIRLYACPYDVATAPASSVATASASSARVSWSTPAFTGVHPITGWRVTASNGRSWTAAATARALTVGGLNPAAPVSFHVAALSAGGTGLVGTTAVINATSTSLASSAAKVKKNKAFRLTATVVRRGTRTRAAAVPVVLQRKVGSTWRTLASGTTSSAGAKAWVVKEKKAAYYRVVSSAKRTWWGSASGARKVATKK